MRVDAVSAVFPEHVAHVEQLRLALKQRVVKEHSFDGLHVAKSTQRLYQPLMVHIKLHLACACKAAVIDIRMEIHRHLGCLGLLQIAFEHAIALARDKIAPVDAVTRIDAHSREQMAVLAQFAVKEADVAPKALVHGGDSRLLAQGQLEVVVRAVKGDVVLVVWARRAKANAVIVKLIGDKAKFLCQGSGGFLSNGVICGPVFQTHNGHLDFYADKMLAAAHSGLDVLGIEMLFDLILLHKKPV